MKYTRRARRLMKGGQPGAKRVRTNNNAPSKPRILIKRYEVQYLLWNYVSSDFGGYKNGLIKRFSTKDEAEKYSSKMNPDSYLIESEEKLIDEYWEDEQ